MTSEKRREEREVEHIQCSPVVSQERIMSNTHVHTHTCTHMHIHTASYAHHGEYGLSSHI